MCLHSLTDTFRTGIRDADHNQQEIDMSADKDRGIRRQKQKRAKARKKQARQQQKPAEQKKA